MSDGVNDPNLRPAPAPAASLDELAEQVAREAGSRRLYRIAQLTGAWIQQYGAGGMLTPDATADAVVNYLAGRGIAPEDLQAIHGLIVTLVRDHANGKCGQSTASPCPANDVADPVEHARGELVHEETDLVVRGAGLDFSFKRTYRHQTVYAGPLGHRWDHGYNLFLRVDELEATLWVGAGRSEQYRRHGHWGTAGCNYYVPPDGVDATLEPLGPPEAPTGWERRAPDGLRHVFEPDDPSGGGWRLARIEDRWGNYLAFDYDTSVFSGQDRIREVLVNHPQRRVQFAYDEHDRIIRLTDHTTRAWRYRYDDHGDLIAVTTPETPDSPRGDTTRYRYSSAERTGPLAHLLTDIFDAAGRHYLHTTYGVDSGDPGYNRVVRQRLGGGEYAFRYEHVQSPDPGLAPEDRPTLLAWVRERNGHTTLYVYNATGGLLWKRETDRGPGHATRRAIWRYRYNRDGALIASRSPEGVVRQTLTGRDHYLRARGIAPESEEAERLWDRADLTAAVRRGFGRVLATVDRASRHTAGTIGWADHFGDVYAVDADDIIVKYTYEAAYGQILTVSDPRTTTTSDPEGVEPAEYEDHLTRYEYVGPPGDETRGLLRMSSPIPTLPDATPGTRAVAEVMARDADGRVTSSRDSSGTETLTAYFTDDDPRHGFVQSVTIDPGNPLDGHLHIETRYQVDPLGRVIATTLPRGVAAGNGEFVVESEYDALDRVVTSRAPTPLATETRTSYEPAGKPRRIETDWTSPVGSPTGPLVKRFVYDEEHHLREEYSGGPDHAGQRRVAHRYNAAGLRSLTLAANDTATRWQYDSRDQLARTIRGPGAGEAIEELVRDRDGRVIEARSAEGRNTRSEYDAFGRVVQVTDPLGHITRTTYDKGGRPTIVRSFERVVSGGVTAYKLLARSETVYDELGRAIRSIASRFTIPPAAVSPASMPTAYLTGAGVGTVVETQMFLAAAGRPVRVVDPESGETTTEYDAAGRVVRVTDPTSNEVVTTYDLHGNAVRVDRIDVVRDLTGAAVGTEAFTTLATYDQRDRLVTATDALGNVTTHEYDSLDREVRTTDALGNVRERRFDVHGDLVEMWTHETDTGDGGGDPLVPHVVTFEYDRAGLMTARIDALGRRTEYRYDKLNRRVEEIFPGTDGSRVVTRYDRDSLVTAVRDAHGVVLRTQYDEAGRPYRTTVDVAEVDSGVTIAGSVLVEHTYDGLGRPIQSSNETATIMTTFNSLGFAESEETTVTDGLTPTVLQLTRLFDDAGRLTSTTYPGGREIAHDRDAAGRLLAIRQVAAGTGYPGVTTGARTVATYAHAGNRLRAVEFGNGAEVAYAHDARGGVVDLHHTGPGGTILRVQELRDGVRTPRVRRDERPSATDFERFGYDSRYQLTARVDDTPPSAFDPSPFAPPATPPTGTPTALQPLIDTLIGGRLGPTPPSGADAWAYDKTGNRSAVTTSAVTVGYTADVRDRYDAIGTTEPTYDRAGNLTFDGVHDYIYDGLRRLVQVRHHANNQDVVRYAYDPGGRRVVEERPGSDALVIAHDGVDRIADFRNGTCVAQYVHGSGIDDPVELAGGGAEHIFHTDLQGSVRALTDSSGAVAAFYRFDPFGVLVASTGPAIGPPDTATPAATQPFGYAGRPLDPATHQYDFRARVYVPLHGRFLQRDPAGPVDGHLYSFAGNDPLAFGDPSGESRTARSSQVGATSRVRDEIDEEFAHYREHVDKQCARFNCTGTSRQHVFDVYRDILDDIEVSVRTGHPIDVRGLWKRARRYELWDSFNVDWMYTSALTGGADQTIGANGVFGGGRVASEYFPTGPWSQDPLSGVPIDALFKLVTARENPKPTTVEKGTKAAGNLLTALVLLGVMRTPGPPAVGIVRGPRARVVFQGMEVRGMRDLSHMSTGRLQAQARFGFAAHDHRGRPLQLHHLRQRPEGPVVEIPAKNHRGANRIQHPHGNAPGAGLTEAQRDVFDSWRQAYWQARAVGELARRGIPFFP